ncbi:MAG: phosphopentomutase [Pseudomonadota bacterium]
MRALIVVLDSVGVGAMPDAAAWGDAGADTLGHCAEAAGPLRLPNLQRLGLGNIHPVNGVPAIASPEGAWGSCLLAAPGKDSVTGHWELAGCVREDPFGFFHQGFPPAIMDPFHAAIGMGSLGNYAASGTVIIDELGAEHMASGLPIVYTSADSVFQVAAHEEVIPLPELYRICELAFEIVKPFHVARVIARPFVGRPGAFRRTENRRDFALEPDTETVLDRLVARGLPVTSVGKVKNLYGGRGFTEALKAGNNAAVVDGVLERLAHQEGGLIFANLVDFDMLWGHRRDPEGYARGLEAFDLRLPEILAAMRPGDLLLITADHGNDPCFPGSDHTRERVPLLGWRPGCRGVALGERRSLADVGATVAEHLGVGPLAAGESFLAAFPPLPA